MQKQVLFEEEMLYLYKLADSELAFCDEVANQPGEYYTFFLDRCSDYIITNVEVETGGGDASGDSSDKNSGGGSGGDAGGTSRDEEPGSGVDAGGEFGDADHQGAGPGRPPSSPGGGADLYGAPAHADADADLYDHLPRPDNQPARLPTANGYLEDAAVRQTFADSRDGLVVLDVNVKTVASGLALQLLAENPDRTL